MEPPRWPGPGFEPTQGVPRGRAPLPVGPARLVPGLQLGPWRLDAELGRGGMGAVWRATDVTLGREAALKVLLDLASRDAEARSRFLREGQLAARVLHPGIVRIYAVGEAPVPWLACELVRGARPLTAAAAGRPRTDGVRLVVEAARALGFAHAHGVVHRDVKPDNLLVGEDGRVRVTDFGISTALDVERLTVTGGVLGTPAYMAPEQLEGDRAAQGPWTDVWALGVVLYEVLTGERPFGSGSAMELAARVLHGRGDAARSPRARRPDVPAALEAVVLRALAFEPAGRFVHAEAFADALEAALEAALAAPAPPPRRAWPLLVVPALGLAAALPIGGWWLTRDRAAAPVLLPPAPVAPAPVAPVAPPPPPTEAPPAGVAEVWSKTVAVSWDAWDKELTDSHRDLHLIWQEAVQREERDLALARPGVSKVQLRVYLEGEPTWARLELHHIATEVEGEPRCWVDLDVNDQRVETRLAPRLHDALDITRWARPGENRLTVTLHPDSRSVYWLRNVRLRYGDGASPWSAR